MWDESMNSAELIGIGTFMKVVKILFSKTTKNVSCQFDARSMTVNLTCNMTDTDILDACK